MKVIQTEVIFLIGEIVFLVTDPDQNPGIVTALNIQKDSVVYVVNKNGTETWHYDFELSSSADIVFKTGN